MMILGIHYLLRNCLLKLKSLMKHPYYIHTIYTHINVIRVVYTCMLYLKNMGTLYIDVYNGHTTLYIYLLGPALL